VDIGPQVVNVAEWRLKFGGWFAHGVGVLGECVMAGNAMLTPPGKGILGATILLRNT
jgi:hypothetical protein